MDKQKEETFVFGGIKDFMSNKVSDIMIQLEEMLELHRNIALGLCKKDCICWEIEALLIRWKALLKEKEKTLFN